MIDWTASMQQVFEFYIVDPATWKNKTLLTKVTSCTIDYSLEDEIIAGAKIDIEEDIGECYIRVYLVCNQNGESESVPLGTFLVQTPSTMFDGRTKKRTLDCYSPLLELRDIRPPQGYALMKGDKIMDYAYRLTQENARAPVVPAAERTDGNDSLMFLQNNFLADFSQDTWFSFINDLIANAKCRFMLDEMGRILFAAEQKLSAMQPKWEYRDNEISILKADITSEQDLYGVPNVVEVLYSTGSFYRFSRIENTDETSPVSIPARGRVVLYRESNPGSLSNPSQEELDSYAEDLLESLSSMECRLTYTHGYNCVHIGDCVLINYERAGLINIKAKVVSQTITCTPGCEVNETVVYTKKVWEVLRAAIS